MREKDLSGKQRRILEYIRGFIDEHDYPPSIRQIQDACGISSTSVVDYNLKALEGRGLIRRDREVSRAIEVLEGGSRRARVVPVPILGTIAAGQAIEVPEDSRWSDGAEAIEVPPEVVRNHENVFAVRVKGNSMIDALVSDGDIVVLEVTSAARDGEMVAALLKREQATTLKKFYRQGAKVRLQPCNEAMEPIIEDADNVTVQGRVIHVSRSY
ncbi:MAG TPA: transcriptional repressor LexA [Dehalococcoidia bacterium]|nr:transcriptional repressor LexA [Dehalococcoidia bacterium]